MLSLSPGLSLQVLTEVAGDPQRVSDVQQAHPPPAAGAPTGGQSGRAPGPGGGLDQSGGAPGP